MALGKTLRDARLRKKMTTSQVASATRIKVQMVEALEREDFSKICATIYGKGFLRLYAECVGIDPQPLVEEYVNSFAATAAKPSLIGEEVAAARKAATGVAPENIPVAAPQVEQGTVGAQEEQPRRRDILFEDIERQAHGGTLVEFDPQATASVGENVFGSRQTTRTLKYVSIAIGAIVVLVFLVSAAMRWMGGPSELAQPLTSTTVVEPDKTRNTAKDSSKASSTPATSKPAERATQKKPSGNVRPVIDPPPPYVD